MCIHFGGIFLLIKIPSCNIICIFYELKFCFLSPVVIFFWQQYIHTLEGSLQEEMSRHAPLYGVGLESLSMKELETLTRIHEEGLRQIHATQQMKTNGHSLAAGHPLTQAHGLYSSASSVPIGIPPSIISNGVGIHGNGHINGSVGPWYGPS